MIDNANKASTFDRPSQSKGSFCDICDKSYKTKNGLEKHMTTHEVIPQLDGNNTLEHDSTLNEAEKVDNSIIEVQNATPTSENDDPKPNPFKLKVKIAANSHDCALNALTFNILYILDSRIEPEYLPLESLFDLTKLIENKFLHIFVFNVTLPEDIVFIDQKEICEDWRNNVKGLSTKLIEFLIL